VLSAETGRKSAGEVEDREAKGLHDRIRAMRGRRRRRVSATLILAAAVSSADLGILAAAPTRSIDRDVNALPMS
jgi:hypothetical protein